MGRVTALGEQPRVAGLALAGVDVIIAEGAQAVHEAWQALPADVDLVILSPAAAAVLGSERLSYGHPLTAVMPQ
ncbi:hypothetical protein [Actinacidiphila glaucinigra]|uniref:hypothetical protein n=1 Tax=Actinacidiphila glaucinigra TaxID=235986 RepID=UPI0036E9C204